MANVSDETIKAAIHRGMNDVKTGNAFMDGDLEETDFELLQMGVSEKINKLFHMVSKRLGQILGSPKKIKKTCKSILGILESQREKWTAEIQDYGGNKEPATAVEPVSAKKPSAVMEKETNDDSPVEPKAAAPSSDSALMTGDTKVADTGVKVVDPVDIKVEGVALKAESQKPESEQSEPTKEELADMDTEEPDKEDAPKGDGDSKPKAVPDDTPGDEKRTQDMGVEESAEAGTEAKTDKSKKRKSDAMDDKKTPRKKSKGTKGRKTSEKKKKRRKKTGPTQEQIEATREKVKKECEKEKAEILEALSEDYTSFWSQCGFAKWKKDWLPCLFVSPFNVGGSGLRDNWVQMFHNTEERRHDMTHLVYWYGQTDMNSAYSFIPQKQIVTYDEGVRRGYDKLAPKTQKKVDEGKKLTKVERELLKGLEELEADLLRQPEERTNFEGFYEDYENEVFIKTLLTGEDSGDELISSDEDGDESLSSASSSSELESDSDEEEKKVSSKAKKAKMPGKKPAAKKPAATMESTMEDEMDFAEAEFSSSDDSKDEELLLDDEESDSDDERDVDYIVNEPGSKKKRGRPKKQEKGKIERKRSKTPKEKGPSKPTYKPRDSDLARTRQQNKLFKANQETFIPILQKWKSYIKDEDVDSIQGVLQQMLKLVDEMGAPFMEVYNVSPLMKTTKELLRQKNADLATHKALMKRLGQSYAEKKKLVPQGYKPKMMEKQNKKKRKKDKTESTTAKEDRKSKEGGQKPKRVKKESSEPSSVDRHESTSSLPGSLPASQSSTAPGTPIRLVHSQGSSSPKRFASPGPDLSQGSRKVSSKKSEKTSFSLSNMINKKPTASQSSEVEANREKPSSQTMTIKSLPLWLTSSPTGEIESLPAQQVDRRLALEFFQSMAACFPEDKVNGESIARSLEAAVYQWSKEQYRKEDTYWPKVHAVVAAICGKRKPGTLLAAIVAGEYETAMDVVTLSDDMLLHSFEGS